MSVTLARKLADAGASPEVIAIAVEAVTLASRSVVTPSRSKEAERAARYRQKLKQDKGNAEANDAAQTDSPKRDGVTTRHDAAPTFLPSLSLNLEGSIEEGRKAESKKARSENARARGTRMIAGAVLSDVDRAAAIELGAPPESVDGMWAEFVDYWAGIPGQRGTKLGERGWSGTWRNRVRTIVAKGNGNGHRTGTYRTNTAADGRETGTGAILAGVAAAASRRARERGQGSISPNAATPGDDDARLI